MKKDQKIICATIILAVALLASDFITMTPLGLGDIVPTHNFVRFLTILQFIFGQLFVATTIARLVSMWKVKT